jgi:hypothetical protein
LANLGAMDSFSLDLVDGAFGALLGEARDAEQENQRQR